jgi:hypothetical protein
MLLHKTRQEEVPSPTEAFIPAKGPVPGFEQLRDELYMRHGNKHYRAAGLRLLPEHLSTPMIRDLERRNLIMARVRWSLFLASAFVMGWVLYEIVQWVRG